MDSTTINIKFEKVNYYVSDGMLGIENLKREVLLDINGEFRGCELTAIIGPSGSGKTTLLNILSGYTTNNVRGNININGLNEHAINCFRVAYIMQDYKLHHYITLRESMNFSIRLKTGSRLSSKEREKKIQEILKLLGLDDKMETFVGNLSGGEQKRLSIALELVDDPQIMFFDEPTTGLDSSSSTQCLSLMKKLAQSGKTIICTIHQPSALLFEMFDHLYALSDGMCIYQGSSKNLVPFLAELDLICPESYSPCDYLLEIATNDYGPQNDRLTDKIENGKNEQFRNISSLSMIDNHYSNPIESHQKYSTSFSDQLHYLLIRNYLITYRNKCHLLMRLIIHSLIGLLIGIMYYGIGQDASNIFNIYKYQFISIFILMFTAFSSLQTTFPFELNIIRREIFNRWYSTEAYFLALTITDVPIVIVTNFIYVSITYVMTNQPMEGFRFVAFYCIVLLLSFSAQGLGLLAGSMLNVKLTLILGSFFLCPFVLFSNFFLHMKDARPVFQWLFQGSFIKYALDGLMTAIFGYNRDKMKCSVNYCHYRWPHKFLESLEVNETLYTVIIKLLAFVIVFRILSFVIMKHRLR